MDYATPLTDAREERLAQMCAAAARRDEVLRGEPFQGAMADLIAFEESDLWARLLDTGSEASMDRVRYRVYAIYSTLA